MYPILLELGSFRLHSYGVVVLVALVVGLWLAGREATRKGLDAGLISDVATGVILAGVAGARLAYVIGWEPELFWRDPAGVFAVWRGGLALHGGLLAGFAVGLWLCRRSRVDPWVVGDAVAPALILGQGIGRLACLLSGDAYGTPTTLPWAITFTNPEALAPLGVPLHPAQLYELGLDLGLFALLWIARTRLAGKGQLFLVYVAGYGAIRLLTETVRGDRLELGLGLSLLQAASLALLLAALAAWGWRRTMATG
ncbi:MAG: prolipoprotein diacylglyceryl transferase [Candidatus Rokubacteria bacterium]|nr:prolipoprotein diacylglyceryl transferase [Candidatus Rokubacteria bacterium]